MDNAGWGRAKDKQAISILKAFTNCGGNLVDTFDAYGPGTSERIIKNFLRSADKEIFIATKLERRLDKPFGRPQNLIYNMNRLRVENPFLKILTYRNLFLHCFVAYLS